MVMTTASSDPILQPEQIHDVLVVPVTQLSVAFQVSTQITLNGASSFRVPLVTADPSASWVAEGAEIPLSDLELDEAVAVPSKVAGLTAVTNELRADSSPEATEQVGRGLARDIQTKVDAAFFGSTTTNGPAGLQSLTGVSNVAGTHANSDWAIIAQSQAEQVGAKVDAFVASPQTAATLATAKEGASSERHLLQPDPTSPSGRVVAGVPLLSSSAVAAGTVWGLPKDRVFVVTKKPEPADWVVDSSVFFTSDRSAVRAILRVGFCFSHPAAIQRISLTAPAGD